MRRLQRQSELSERASQSGLRRDVSAVPPASAPLAAGPPPRSERGDCRKDWGRRQCCQQLRRSRRVPPPIRKLTHRRLLSQVASCHCAAVASLPSHRGGGMPFGAEPRRRGRIVCFGLAGAMARSSARAGPRSGWAHGRSHQTETSAPCRWPDTRHAPPNLMLTSAWVAPLVFRGLLHRETIQESSTPSSDQILLAATLAGMH